VFNIPVVSVFFTNKGESKPPAYSSLCIYFRYKLSFAKEKNTCEIPEKSQRFQAIVLEYGRTELFISLELKIT
jgi:hypothetical protein